MWLLVTKRVPTVALFGIHCYICFSSMHWRICTVNLEGAELGRDTEDTENRDTYSNMASWGGPPQDAIYGGGLYDFNLLGSRAGLGAV